MRAGLVLASFTMTPERRAPASAAPASADAREARIVPVSRGVVRGLRDYDEPEPTPSPLPAPETSPPAAVEAVPDGQPAEGVDPEPEATSDPAPDPTPAPTPEPTPRSAARPIPAATNPTTAWAEVPRLELINASRALVGLVSLSVDFTVAGPARTHRTADAQVRYVSRDDP